MPHNKQQIDEMVRDFCSVVPRSKSEVRRRIETALDTAYETGRREMIKELYMSATLYSDGSHTLMSSYLERKYPEIFKEINLFPNKETNGK